MVIGEIDMGPNETLPSSMIDSPKKSDSVALGEPVEPEFPYHKHRWKRWLRFNLRLFILAVSIICLWLAWHGHRAQKQRDAVKAMREIGGWVGYDFQYADGKPIATNPGSFDPQAKSLIPQFLLDLLGYDFFHSVVDLNLIADPELNKVTYAASEWSEHLEGFPNLIKLSIKGKQVDDSALTHIGDLNQLEILVLWGQDRVNLSNGLSIGSTTDSKFSHFGIQQLVNARKLRHLNIGYCLVNDEVLRHLATLPNLERLSAQGNRFTDAGVRYLLNNRKLTSLKIGSDENDITDESVPVLSGIPNLKTLWIQNSKISFEGAAEIGKQLPNCKLIHTPRPF